MFIVQSSFCPFMTLNWLIKKLKLYIQNKSAEDYCTKSTSIIITKTNHEDRKKNSDKRKQIEENNIHHENADNIYTKASLMHHVNELCLRNERKLWRHRCFWLECNTHTDNTSLSAKGIGLNRYQRPAPHIGQIWWLICWTSNCNLLMFLIFFILYVLYVLLERINIDILY